MIFGSSGFFANAGALLIYSIVARLIVNQEQILKLQQQNHQLELQTVHLEQYCKQLPDHSLITFCENIDANIVLSHYAQEAERLGIAYSVVANIPASYPVEDHDLSVLFGNLLENAVDACVASKTTARSIFVRAVYEKGSLCIAIDNTFDGKIMQDPDGTFLSSKHAGKGLGTVSVRTIASKYHGTCRFDWKDQMFFCIRDLLWKIKVFYCFCYFIILIDFFTVCNNSSFANELLQAQSF